MDEPSSGDVCVFDPHPWFTVTIEKSVDETAEVHFHAGGQGYWVARMAHLLGARTTFCGAFGGESGSVIRHLVQEAGMAVCGVDVDGANGGYVHDRRSGERHALVEVGTPVLNRHQIDDLVDAVLALAVKHRVTVLTGPSPGSSFGAEIYASLAANVRALGGLVVADVACGVLEAFGAGLSILKVAHDDLVEAGLVRQESDRALVAAARTLHEQCADLVIVSRAGDQPALVVSATGLSHLHVPRLEAVDHRGAGDSMTAAAAVGLARGLDQDDLLRLSGAAGAVNVTRHGLGSGRSEHIEALAARVRIERVDG